MSENGGRNWVGIALFIGAIVVVNVLSHVFEWGFIFY